MKTDSLIDLLARDLPPRPAYRQALAAALAVALAAALAGMLLTLGVRPDIAAAMATPRFAAKLAFAVALVGTATASLLRLGRPGARLRAVGLALGAVGLALAVLVLLEMASVPASQWRARLIGSNAAVCLVAIPLLSLVPLGAFLAFMRRAAPASPALAGAACGLAAGAVGAAAYALHCPDDSPFFVAVWYLLALAIVAAAGALAGARLLRW